MARVHHRVGIQAPVAEIFEALVLPDRLTGWWASGATGTCAVGAELDLAFEGLTHLIFEPLEVTPNHRLVLLCRGEPDIWAGSRLSFDLQEAETQVYLRLTHEKAGADDESFLYFNTKWPLFLVSLKEFLETGRGRPYPDDVRIDHDL